MNGKIKYIAGEVVDNEWQKLDCFELKLEGIEIAICYAIWQVRIEIVTKAQESIDMVFKTKDYIKLPGRPKTETIMFNSSHYEMPMDFKLAAIEEYPVVKERDIEETIKRYTRTTIGEKLYRIPAKYGKHLLGSLLWATTAGNAKPENITKEKPTEAKNKGIETFGNELKEELDIIDEEVIVMGYNKSQTTILQKVQDLVINYIGEKSGDYKLWTKVYTIKETGEAIFRIQELLMQNFPDPLDKLKNEEMETAKAEIAAKNEEEDEKDPW